MKYVRQIARIFSGLVFIFSGLSKGVDPLGSMYKFIDYFTAFGLDSLNNMALILGIALCTAEFLIGFAILTGIRIKQSSWGLLLFMLVFTPLTLVLAIKNPVSDCGCFGDAIHLTNWQTFFKNLFILIPVVFVFLQRNKYDVISSSGKEWLTLSVVTIVFLVFIQLNYKYLPFIDFRPYKVGTDIEESMIIPEEGPFDEYDIGLIYEKDGVREEFTLENYPSDSSWVFIDQKSTLIKKGYVPPIHDFSLSSLYGDDLTDRILNDPGYTLLMISTKINEMDDGSMARGMALGTEAIKQGMSFYILTSSSTDDILQFNNNELFLSGDETTLKTIIRSNPGFVLLSDGIVLNKWSDATIPEINSIVDNLDKFEKNLDTNTTLRLILLMSLISALAYITNILIRKY